MVDWLPTLLSAVKASLPKEHKHFVDQVLSKETDGVDQWLMLANGEPSQRTEFLYNIDPIWDRDHEHNQTISAGIR